VLDFNLKSARTSTRSADRLIEAVRRQALEVEWILETHVHADHLSAAPYIKEKLGGRIGIGAQVRAVQAIFKRIFNSEPGFATDGSQFDHLFADGEAFPIGKLTARALHTPGHTPADLTYLVGDAAFVGDTLFVPDYGTARADFPGGDAGVLYRSIRRILELPAETRLFTCHGIVNLADPGRLFPAPLASAGQHNRRAKEFPDPSCRATDSTSIPRPLKLTMPLRELGEGGARKPFAGHLLPLANGTFHPLDPKPNLVTSPDPAWQERSRSGAVPGHRNDATSGYLLQGNLNPRIAERAHLAHLGFAVWRRDNNCTSPHGRGLRSLVYSVGHRARPPCLASASGVHRGY
jgi:glyoxylase-like metal-dependent hydrolase (beta-lactamase superfamily II)